MNKAFSPCNCLSMCRVLAEQFAEPHSPSCPNYKLERFVRIVAHGSSFLVEPDQVDAVIDNIDGEFTMTDVHMTRERFLSLAEFQGF